MLNGRIALVTGAGRGIGRAIARLLAERGARVVVNDLADATETVRLIEEAGGQAFVSTDDISQPEGVEAMIQRIESEIGPIALVVNNAGITRDAMLHKMTTAQWDAVLSVNLSAPFHVGQACAKRMMGRKYGRIVNIASLAYLGNIGQSNYAATKAGLLGMTRTWALELGRYGITANVVAPGFIETPMTAAIPDPVREKFVKKIPMLRMGQPEDIARTVAFLLSDDAAYVTGQCIQVDGGLGTGIGGLF